MQNKLSQAYCTTLIEINTIYRTALCEHNQFRFDSIASVAQLFRLIYVKITHHRPAHDTHVRTAGVVGFLIVAAGVGATFGGGSKCVTGTDFTVCGNSNGIDGFRYE